MIESISLKSVGSYTSDTQIFDSLNVLNYIYGENGCGKSTIAQYIDCEYNQRYRGKDFSSCKIVSSQENDINEKVLVYDADFIKKILAESTIEGVFVMGENAPELEKDKIDKETRLNKKRDFVKNKKIAIEELRKYIELASDKFVNICWTIAGEYKDCFKYAYTGYMKPRRKFMEKCSQYAGKNYSVRKIDELKSSASFYFSDSHRPQKMPLLPSFDWSNIVNLEKNPILSKKIKGKEDTTIADMINTLENNDWVEQGRKYFDGIRCPFCQQIAPVSLKNDLELYFDETYNEQKACLDEFYVEYKKVMDKLIEDVKKYSQYNGEYFKYEIIEKTLNNIDSCVESNKAKILQKIKEPSQTITIESVEKFAKDISSAIELSNNEIERFNSRIDSFDVDKENLKEEIWEYIGNTISSVYSDYKKEIAGHNAGISSINQNIKDNECEINKLINDISLLSNRLKCTAKPAEDINNILLKFNFENFHIRQEDDKCHYSIVRDDGSIANGSLSEGERTFVAFLYFYQKIKGINQSSGMVEDKIVVFDDPVSSLDSKILYLVSSLIKDIAKNRTKYKVEQIILFTHNVYFFKEVTAQQDGEKSRSSYWIIRKCGKQAYVQKYNVNPICSSYQMLWEEVKQAKNYPKMDVRNTLRRILECYFTMFGKVDRWKLIDPFEEPDRRICESLLQWANDGSHSVYDDLYVSLSEDSKSIYLKVFEEIFRKNGQGDHYDLMMKD